MNKNKKKGIDLATWNEPKDYEQVKNAGVDFVILKVINKSNKPDGRFYEHVAGCNSVGLPIIAGYTYSYANTEDKAREAADAFVNVGTLKGIATMVLDLEDKSMMGLGSKIVPIISIYRETARAANMDFLIYTGAQYYNPCLKPYFREIADIPIWWARYPFITEYALTADVPDNKYLPTGIELAGWQYSSKGVVSGIKGYVDLNVWYLGNSVENIEKEITVEFNPFTEPIKNVRLGTTGNDALWVNWYLWRFGLLKKEQIKEIIDETSAAAIGEAQRRLGLAADQIVEKVTRTIWKKICEGGNKDG